MLVHDYKSPDLKEAARKYTEELIQNHVSGRLKIAPEHTSTKVLDIIRKPSFDTFYKFKNIFDQINSKYQLKQQLVPYFISSHPGCTEADMAELAVITKSLNFHLEQVQDFTPTPMTVATVIYYSGIHPYTLQEIPVARGKKAKETQRQYFFWYQREKRNAIINSLKKIGRNDLIKSLFGDQEIPKGNRVSTRKGQSKKRGRRP